MRNAPEFMSCHDRIAEGNVKPIFSYEAYKILIKLCMATSLLSLANFVIPEIYLFYFIIYSALINVKLLDQIKHNLPAGKYSTRRI